MTLFIARGAIAFLHLALSCLLLQRAGRLHRMERKGLADTSCHRALFPHAIAAGISGTLMSVLPYLEWLPHYLSVTLLMDVLGYLWGGPYAWLHIMRQALLILPFLGIHPGIGGRPAVMKYVAVLTLFPAVFTCAEFLGEATASVCE